MKQESLDIVDSARRGDKSSKVLIARGLQTPGDVEERLARHTAEYMR